MNSIHSKLKIRLATAADAHKLSQLIAQNAQLLLKPHYSEEQLKTFLQYYESEVILEKMTRQTVFCAEIEGEIVGTIALEGKFVMGFYTQTHLVSQGIGTILLKHLEHYAQSQGLSKIWLSASPIGVSFYQNRGWIKVKDFVVDYLGVGFEETLMKKILN